MPKELPPSLKVGTGWIELEIISEPDVVLTTFGYAPFLRVREITTDNEYRFYISAKSLAAPLEKLRKDNGGIFEGIQFRVRKESMDQKARYEVDTDVDFQRRVKRATGIGKGPQEQLKPSEDVKKKLENVLLN